MIVQKSLEECASVSAALYEIKSQSWPLLVSTSSVCLCHCTLAGRAFSPLRTR